MELNNWADPRKNIPVSAGKNLEAKSMEAHGSHILFYLFLSNIKAAQ